MGCWCGDLHHRGGLLAVAFAAKPVDLVFRPACRGSTCGCGAVAPPPEATLCSRRCRRWWFTLLHAAVPWISCVVGLRIPLRHDSLALPDVGENQQSACSVPGTMGLVEGCSGYCVHDAGDSSALVIPYQYRCV